MPSCVQYLGALSLIYRNGPYAESVIMLFGLREQREDGMSSVMVFCPVAARPVYTGIEMDEATSNNPAKKTPVGPIVE
jgi:hypothetical protein